MLQKLVFMLYNLFGDYMQYSELITNKYYQSLNPYDFGFEDCRPSHHFGPAVRPHWLLHYIVSGFGTFIKDGKTYKLGPGQMFIIEPGETTYYEADINKPWNYIWVGFTTEAELPVELPAVLTAPELGKVFEAMKKCSKMGNGKEAYLSGKIWELFAMILAQTKQNEDWLDMAISFMNTNSHNKITIAEIADKVGFDRCYFSTAFKKRKGISPQRFLLNLRMEKAASMMLNSKVKPSVAAVSVGYDDIFVFSKAFKKHFGVSPRSYIAAMSNKEEL